MYFWCIPSIHADKGVFIRGGVNSVPLPHHLIIEVSTWRQIMLLLLTVLLPRVFPPVFSEMLPYQPVAVLLLELCIIPTLWRLSNPVIRNHFWTRKQMRWGLKSNHRVFPSPFSTCGAYHSAPNLEILQSWVASGFSLFWREELSVCFLLFSTFN